jgi:hypothetical protein
MEGGGPVNPFAAPESPVDGAAARPVDVGGFKSLTPLAMAMTVVLALFVLFAAVEIVNCFVAIRTINRILANDVVTDTERSAVDERNVLITQASSILNLAVVVLFCFFMPRANRNVRVFGAGGLSFTPRWAAGVFFVPIWALYKPYQAMKEIWQGSDPDRALGSWLGKAPALLSWWWGMYLTMEGASQLFNNLFRRTRELPEMTTRYGAQIAVCVVSTMSAVLAIAVVRALASRQDERQRRLTAGAAP